MKEDTSNRANRPRFAESVSTVCALLLLGCLNVAPGRILLHVGRAALRGVRPGSPDPSETKMSMRAALNESMRAAGPLMLFAVAGSLARSAASSDVEVLRLKSDGEAICQPTEPLFERC